MKWLRQVVIGLAATGLRISDLAFLHWYDVNLERGLITLTDETTKKSRLGRKNALPSPGAIGHFRFRTNFAMS